MIKIGPTYNFSKITGKDGRSYTYPANCSIYTTNYDLVVETYWQGIAEINDLWIAKALTQTLSTERQQGDMLNFIKLHGSLDWFGLDDGDIVKLDTIRPTYGKREVKGELILYPIQQKDLYLYPWFNLLSRFRQDLQNTKRWLVIGYNFNDEFIRNIFLEALKRKSDIHELILVTPSAEEVLKEKLNGYQNKVKIISKKFGNKQTAAEIIKKFGDKQTFRREIIN